MANSDDTMTIQYSSMHVEEEEEEEDHHAPSHSMSRLSLCTSKHEYSDMYDGAEDDEEDDMIMNLSRLYVDHESEAEADGEFSDGNDGKEGSIGSEDSDKETGWFSLPASPFRRIGQVGLMPNRLGEVKEYGSDKEGKRGGGRRRRLRETWLERAWEMRKFKAADDHQEVVESNYSNNVPSVESECVVIARPKGGGKSLCMDMEEVKACRDLGFDLHEHEWTLEIPSGISASAVDTDSGSNSPIPSWRISSAGDDPRDVKARLKVWAQAVALASTYGLSS